MDVVKSLQDAGIIDDNQTASDFVEQIMEDTGFNDQLPTITVNGTQLNELFNFTIDVFPETFDIAPENYQPLLATAIVNSLRMNLTLTVAEAVEDPNGKWPQGLGNVGLVDAEQFQQLVVASIRDSLNNVPLGFGLTAADISQFNDTFSVLDDFDIFEYSLMVNVILENKVDVYTSTVEHMQSRLIKVSNDIYHLLGASHPSQPTAPIAIQMVAMQIIKAFLNNIFMAVLVFLFILSVMLIYSLMLADVEEKTYEFGMLRALGLEHQSLLMYLLAYGMSFAVPGVVIGLLVAYFVNNCTAYFIATYTGLDIEFALNPWAAFLGIIVGVIMPLLAIYVPIKRALTQNLRDSLDLYHRIVSGLSIAILKLEKLGLSPPQLVCAVLFVVIGFMTYYIVPLAFMMGKFEIFLYLLNIILILMILGLTFMVQLFQGVLERYAAKLLVLCSYVDRKVLSIVLKNLEGHRSRNWKTGLMFCIALSFVIFSGASFALQGRVIRDSLKATLGADLYVRSPSDEIWGLKEGEIRNWIENVYKPQQPGNINAYSFATPPMKDLEGIKRVTISPLCEFPAQRTTIIGVEPNYLHAIYQEYFIPTETDDSMSFPSLENGEEDLVAGLYTEDGIDMVYSDIDPYGVLATIPGYGSDVSSSIYPPIKMIVPEGLRVGMSIDTSIHVRLRMSVTSHNDAIFRGRVRGMAAKLPGYFFSSYQQIMYFSTSLISMKDYKNMLDYYYDGEYPSELTDHLTNETTYGLPKQTLRVMLKSGLSTAQREILANGIRNFFEKDTTILVDVVALAETAGTTMKAMEIFFIVVGLIALILAFFLLWSSFNSNVRENSWEYGVLRAVGIPSDQCTRIYIYEALAISMTAAFLGTAVGLLIATTVVLQMNLFTELPFHLDVSATVVPLGNVPDAAVCVHWQCDYGVTVPCEGDSEASDSRGAQRSGHLDVLVDLTWKPSPSPWSCSGSTKEKGGDRLNPTHQRSTSPRPLTKTYTSTSKKVNLNTGLCSKALSDPWF